MQTIQIRRHIGDAATPPAAAVLAEGELALNHPATGLDVANGALYIRTTPAAVLTLVSASRQIETTGVQGNLQGRKTFAAGVANGITLDVTQFQLMGGVAGNILSTTGGGVLAWTGAPGGGIAQVDSDDTLTGTGVAPDLLSVVPATATARGAVSVPVGSALTLGGAPAAALGMAVASAADIDAAVPGNILPITPAGLRSQLGLPLSGMTSPGGTIIPAINLLRVDVDALAGNLRFGGGYDVAQNIVNASAGSPWAPGGGALPPATTAMTGWYLIVESDATTPPPPAPNPPAGTYARGDWLVVDAAPAYIHLLLGKGPIYVDNVSIVGTGAAPGPGNELAVGTVDGGTY